MDLSPRDIALIRESHAWLAPETGRLSTDFYEDLFRRNPHVRALFGHNLGGKGMRFMAAIGFIVAHLDDGDALALHLDRLAKRHAGLAIGPDAAEAMEGALADTFRHPLAPHFTRAHEAAWRRAIAQVCAVIAPPAGTRRAAAS